MLLAEAGEDGDRVVTDRRESQPSGAKFLELTLQLDQLRFTVGSPVGRANKHEHRALRSHDRLQCPDLSVLVLEAEIGHALANLRS